MSLLVAPSGSNVPNHFRFVADEASGAVQQVLHTLKDEEVPIELQAKAMKRYRLISEATEKGSAELQEEQVIKWFFRVRGYPVRAAALHDPSSLRFWC